MVMLYTLSLYVNYITIKLRKKSEKISNKSKKKKKKGKKRKNVVLKPAATMSLRS